MQQQSDCETGERLGRRLRKTFNLRYFKKQNAPDPEKPGAMRFQQGLLPCQFIVRSWPPVFSIMIRYFGS
jgi:hypothetical protein